jgi:hypothetical protein
LTVLDIPALSRDDTFARTPDAAYAVLADLDNPV